MAPIEEAGLSSKEKAIKHSRDLIFTKLSTNVGLIKTQFEVEDQLCEEARLSSKTKALRS